jgi:lipoprotein-anchoring transpeptidase ErfK/SrfK
MRHAYAIFSALWLILFAVITGLIAHQGTVLRRTYDRLESTAATLNSNALAIQSKSVLIKSEGAQLGFLESLINLLPQEKSFIRTQKAMTTEVETLRRKVGRRLKDELHVVVDTRANKLYLKKGLNLLWEADCSVGKGGILVDKATGRRWEFVTPRGKFEIHSKIEKPLWNKPDWAFVESKEPVPPPDDPRRKVEGELGGYVMNLGDGYLIHGTKTEALLGRSVSHGCVRLGAENLKKLYDSVGVGTPVYIY